MKIYLISFMLLMLCLPNSSYAKRYALVIGNSNYGRDLGNLDNPVNDATDMAALLKRKKFNVIKLTNATKRQMSKGISRFTKQLQEEHAVGLFFFAGHGVEVDGRNYLIPIKANIDGEADVEFESVNASRVMRNMEKAGNNLNMIILDACRNNPYARSFRSASRGLAEVNPPKGSLILYATSPGDVASDGSGRNGLFTQHLLKAINTPNLKVEDVFKRTANKVYNDTARKQLPWQSGVMLGDFYFSGQQAIKKTVAAIGVANNHQQAEISFWNSIADETNAAYFQSYVNKYPQGEYIDLALLKLEEYRIPKEVLKQSPQLTIKTSPDNARIRILNIAPKYRQGMSLKAGRYHIEVSKAGYRRHTEWIDLTDARVHDVVLNLNNSPIVAQKQNPLISLSPIQRNRAITAKMVAIKAGCFQMGSPSWEKDRGSNEKQHQVCVSRFQMADKEVTVGEFKRFIKATGYRTQAEQNIKEQGCFTYSSSENKWARRAGNNWHNVGFSQQDKHPVVCVSWRDVQSYLDWLNQQGQGGYRLPTEAEWEYAARGGTQWAYFWGNKVDAQRCRYANVNDKNWANKFLCNDSYKFTAPVGSYQANALGLYDMSGNVWEWTCSRYDKNYQGGETQCLNNNQVNDSDVLVVRGGSLSSKPWELRVAYRLMNPLWRRYGDWGFRIARTP